MEHLTKRSGKDFSFGSIRHELEDVWSDKRETADAHTLSAGTDRGATRMRYPQSRPMNEPEDSRSLTFVSWVAVGAMIGVTEAGAPILPELYRRFAWAWSGGGGESSDWGEPLFYLVVMGAPGAVVGGLIAWGIAVVVGRLGRFKD